MAYLNFEGADLFSFALGKCTRPFYYFIFNPNNTY